MVGAETQMRMLNTLNRTLAAATLLTLAIGTTPDASAQKPRSENPPPSRFAVGSRQSNQFGPVAVEATSDGWVVVTALPSRPEERLAPRRRGSSPSRGRSSGSPARRESSSRGRPARRTAHTSNRGLKWAMAAIASRCSSSRRPHRQPANQRRDPSPPLRRRRYASTSRWADVRAQWVD